MSIVTEWRRSIGFKLTGILSVRNVAQDLIAAVSK